MIRRLVIVVGLATITSSVLAMGIGREGSGFGRLGSMGKSTAATPAPTGLILLVDGTSKILKTDGTSRICRAGGC